MKQSFVFKRKYKTKRYSRRYIVTILQIIGIAFCSSFASYVFNAIMANDFKTLTSLTLGFLFSIILLAIGIYLLLKGWQIMVELDISEAKNEH